MKRTLTRRQLLAEAGQGVAATALLSLTACALPQDAPPLLELCGRTMGTTYGLQVRPPRHGLDSIAFHVEVGRLFAQVESQMSAWRADSELCRFNAVDDLGWFPVSASTAQVVAAALEMRDAFQGAFDPAIATLVDLWGFGPHSTGRAVPARARLESWRLHRGAGVAVRASPPALRKRDPQERLDLSAIAQGHALDELSALCSHRGLEHYLLEVGGELRSRGRPSPAHPWRVSVKAPGSHARRTRATLDLEEAAISTSGVHVHRFEQGGRQYTHILDPRTGRPVEHDLAAVTVVAPTAMEADASATALLVLGPEEGLRVARERDLAALFVVLSGGSNPHEHTPAFAAHLATGKEG